MLNTEFDREYIYDVDAYLIANYPQMSLTQRRSVCSKMYEYIDEELIEDAIDTAVAGYALDKLQLQKKEPEDED